MSTFVEESSVQKVQNTEASGYVREGALSPVSKL